MKYRKPIESTLHSGYHNLGSLSVLSVGISLTFVPLVATVLVGTPVAVLGGLWATSLLFGISIVVAFRYATRVAKRGVSIDLWPTIAPAIQELTSGLAVGVLTFGVVVGAVAVYVLTPESYQSVAVGIASFLLIVWYLLIAFAAPELGDGQRLRYALRSSSIRIIESLDAAVWFLFLSFACALIAGVTLITVVLFLPGTLVLLAAQLTCQEDSNTDF